MIIVYLHFSACGCMHRVITLFFWDPFTCHDLFLVGDRRIVSPNEGRRLQRRGSHKCAFPRGKKWTKRLGGHACSDRALGRFRTYEEPRWIVQSRTIERGVLGTICGRRHGHRERPGGRIGRAVEGHARGVRTGAKACRPHAARFVSLPLDNARLPGGLPSRRRLQKSPPRSAHWGWTSDPFTCLCMRMRPGVPPHALSGTGDLN